MKFVSKRTIGIKNFVKPFSKSYKIKNVRAALQNVNAQKYNAKMKSPQSAIRAIENRVSNFTLSASEVPGVVRKER